MRLTCPNCGAEYEVPDGMVPAAGRHVQCTACHTRWFVRGVPRHRPDRGPDPAPPRDLVRPAPARRRRPTRRRADPASRRPDAAPPGRARPPKPADRRRAHLPPRAAAPAKPADRPAVAQPGPPRAPAPPSRARAPRLDLGEPARARRAAAPAQPLRPRLLLALVLAALALGAYVYRDAIAARVPAAPRPRRLRRDDRPLARRSRTPRPSGRDPALRTLDAPRLGAACELPSSDSDRERA